MNIVVCVKRVPDTAGLDIELTEDSCRIKEEGLVFDINEWDRYAVEEAVRLKEKSGGTVTVISLGPEGVTDTLRKCLAMGCDEVLRLTDADFERSDAVTMARILYRVIKNIKFDLLLTGAQAGDDGCGQVGPALARLLGVPNAALVTAIEIADGAYRVHRELESGLEEVVEVKLPAVLTIQTGINEPRYVSIRTVMKVVDKEIKVLDREALGMRPDEVGEAGSRTRVDMLSLPPVTKDIEILPADPAAAATRLMEIVDNEAKQA